MSDLKIHIPARVKLEATTQQVIRVSPEAYNALVEIYNESTLSIKEIASVLILEAAKHVSYVKEG